METVYAIINCVTLPGELANDWQRISGDTLPFDQDSPCEKTTVKNSMSFFFLREPQTNSFDVIEEISAI